MRRKNARQILADAFLEVAESKDMEKITVRDIVNSCGYSATTFYRKFKDKYDLIVWSYARNMAGTMEQVGADGFEWRHTLLEEARFFHSHRDVFANLLLHATGHDAFIQHMTEINYQALKAHILNTQKQDALDETTDMYVRMYCMGTVCLTCDWISGRYKASPEKLAEVYENGLPLPLKPLLM